MIQWILRELRSLRHRAWIVIGAISLGVGAVTMVHALADSVNRAVQSQAKPMMAADLVVRSMHPPPSALYQIESEKLSETREMLSMTANDDGESLLCEIKAVGGEYPLYGQVVLGSNKTLEEALNEETVVVGSSLLRRLNANIGDNININGVAFSIADTIEQEPDRMNVGMTSGPRVMMNLEGLKRSQLEQFGSRIVRKVQYKASDDLELKSIQKAIAPIVEENSELRVMTVSSGNPRMGRSINLTERFLSLLALLSVLVGSIGVVQGISAWLKDRRRAIATYRCLGMSNTELLTVFGGSVFLLGLVGSVVGMLLAMVGLLGLSEVLQPYLPIELNARLSWAAVIEGSSVGVLAAIAASIFPLRQLLSISPVAAFRAHIEPHPMPWKERLLWGTALIAIAVGLAIWQARDPFTGGIFITATLLLTIVLVGAARASTKTLGKIKPKRWALRQALSSFSRPGMGVAGAMVALGLGVMVTLSISLIQTRLQDQIGEIHPDKAPTAFFVDIQPEQIDTAKELFEAHQASHLQSAPVVIGRLSKLKSIPISEAIKAADENQRWAYTREQRLSYDVEIDPKSIVKGQWGSLDANNEICIEERQAKRLGLDIGDTVTFNIQGMPIEFIVSAIRKISWESFELNFFFVAESELLRKAPQFQIAAAQFEPRDEERLQTELVKTMPNVTLISIRSIIDKAATLMEQLGLAIQGMGLFSAAAGLIILIGALKSSALHRSKQIALLRTLGASKGEIRSMFGLEFAILGLIASGIGCIAAFGLTDQILRHLFRISPQMRWELGPIWIALATGLTIATGMWACREPLSRSAWNVIRSE